MILALRQLGALLRLRWVMIRSRRLRVGLVVALGLVVLLAVRLAGSGDAIDPAKLGTAVELAPAAFLGFLVLAVVAPLTSGGGNEVMPPDQLTAYPVRPLTQFLGGLVLAPLNLVWVLQLLTLTAETAFVSRGGSGWRAAGTAVAFVACGTVLGQALAWSVAGLRQTRNGRRLVLGAGAASVLLVLIGIRLGWGSAVLARTPTRTVVHALRGSDAEVLRWVITTGALVVLAASGLWAGARLCGWALRRPGDAGARKERGPVRRRTARATPLRELVAVDRASAWRAPALRRGGLVLAVLPAVGALGAAVPWASLTVLPGLVAAGAGLLFGVNAFALDGPGAVWLASLPHRPRLVATAKALVLTETVLAAVGVASLAGALRSPGAPTAEQLVALVLSALTCTAVVVAVGLGRSLRHPHQALLLGPRDSIAPPGALAFASLQLSAPAAGVGLLFSAAAQSGRVVVPVVLAVLLLGLCALSVRRSLARYDDPVLRAEVVRVVSAG